MGVLTLGVMRKASARVRRLALTEELIGLAPGPPPDYADAFELATVEPMPRTAEQWARASLEGAPRLLRWFVVLGWRLLLGLRLGPRRSAEHVLGWRLLQASPETALTEARSRLMTAQLVFHVEDARFRWMSFVHHRNRVSRLVWVPVGLVHRRIVQYVMDRAASRATRVA